MIYDSWKNDFNSYDPKNLALHVKVLFKDIRINVWLIKILTPFTNPLHNEKIGYEHIILFFASLILLSSFCILDSNNKIHNEKFGVKNLPDFTYAFISKV